MQRTKNKIILLGATWCPITKKAKKLFADIKKERENFDYKYIDINTDEGKKLVDKFSITDVPKTIVGDKIIFHGQPLRDKLVLLIDEKD